MKTVKIGKYELHSLSENLWEISQQGKMKVPARVYSSQKMLETIVAEDNSLDQLVNVATLPGIQKYSLAMPDIHWGYGFPIGGVAAFDWEEGIISPGGVGYDINCGVRLAATNLMENEIRDKIEVLVRQLYEDIPTGVGAHGAIRKLSQAEIKQVAKRGAEWAIENGFGLPEELDFMEENGRIRNVDPDVVSGKALERGRDEVGTLGSGNHFLEIDVVDAVYNPEIAEMLGIRTGQILIQIHTGSRGYGYQICDDFLKIFHQANQRYGIELPDRQLACVPIQSPEGQNYLQAMGSAANFAWANRQVIMDLARKAITKVIKISPAELGFRLIYDVAHNIAKVEHHVIDGKEKKVLVHRKGATRSFGPDTPGVPEKYRKIGQPVLIPGDMGRYSFLAVGQSRSLEATFGSTCHGAGRVQSRKQAIRKYADRDLFQEMAKYGVVVQAHGKRTIAEEMPDVYKDVAEVVEVMHREGISKKVARLKPIGVIKG